MNIEQLVDKTESPAPTSHQPAPDAPTVPAAAASTVPTPAPPAPGSDADLRENPNRPRSDIARLPVGVREMINHSLREGVSYRQIIARITALTSKFHNITPDKLSAWYYSGYADWLRQKTQLENTLQQGTAIMERMLRIKAETGASLPDLLQSLLGSLVQKILQDFDPAALSALLADKPAEFFSLVACLNNHIAACSRHQHAEIARVRCQIDLAQTAQQTSAKPAVLSEELFQAERMSRLCAAMGNPADQLTARLAALATEHAPKKRRRPSRPKPPPPTAPATSDPAPPPAT